MPAPSTTAADTTTAATATSRLLTRGKLRLRMLSGVITTSGISRSKRLMTSPPLRSQARSCGTVPELATAVDDRPRRHVDDQRDREQHQTGGDKRTTTGVVGLVEGVGDVRGDGVTAGLDQVERDLPGDAEG